MEIKVNTDASFNRGIAAWAYWMETPIGTLKDSGLYDTPIDNSSVAELLAFEKAYARLLHEFGIYNKFNMTINTDSQWVVKGLQGEYRDYGYLKPEHIALCKAIRHAIRDHDVTTVHIPGHQLRLSTPELIANNWCDFTARELVRREFTKQYGRYED